MEKRLARIILECVYNASYIDREDLCEIVCAINRLIKNNDSDVNFEWSGNGFYEENDFCDNCYHDGDRTWQVSEFRATNRNTGESIVIYTDLDCKFFLTKIDSVIGETLGFCIASKTKFGNFQSVAERRRAIEQLIEKAFKDGQKALDHKLNVIQSIACIDYHFEVFNRSKTA